MSETTEENILERLERLSTLTRLIRYLIAGAVAMGTALAGTISWVLTQEWTNERQDSHIVEVRAGIADTGGRLRTVESWKEKQEVVPRVAPAEVFALDKRLQRVEDQSQMILETLRRIEGKLP